MKHNLKGKQFGKLRAIRCIGIVKKYHDLWECLCDCGNVKNVLGKSLRSNHTRSCGCSRRVPKSHGHCGTGKRSRTYDSWFNMHRRCKEGGKYSSKGIRVCKRWREFENFLADMGVRPKGRTLDRYPNPAGNYCPENCRWATPKQQGRNKV